MFRIDRITVWIFIMTMALLVPSIRFISYLDEIVAVTLLLLAIIDSTVNRGAWHRYKPLWLLLGIMSFYAVYSLTAVHYNAPLSIIIDIIIESKPFIGLFVIMAISPRFTEADRSILRIIAIVNVAVTTIILLCPTSVHRMILLHISSGGIFIIVSTLVYMYCAIDEEGKLSNYHKAIILTMASCGLLCTRSKYYGEYVILWFFLTLYRPGMLRHLTLKHISVIGAIGALVILVSWRKISYYFIGGANGAESFDPEALESFARPVLYATSFLIFLDHFPFGTGLASFASFRSIEPYSGVYAEYGIDKVWGLSPSKPDFICDAFYPSLAQFGVVGIILFAWLWIYIIRLLGSLIRLWGKAARYVYVTGMMCVAFILIESTSGSAMVNIGGVLAMMLLGMVAGRAREASLQLKAAAEITK